MEFFHILNRGVDKRDVFMSDADYARFVHDLWEFNDESPANPNIRRYIGSPAGLLDVGRPTYEREPLVYIHCFCLMPNHYHLLLSSVKENGISLFMKKLNGGYTKYFNEKYDRSGALWQGKYKSVHINTDRHFLFIPYYIHFNPLDLTMPEWREHKMQSKSKALAFLDTYRWSSHLDYSGKKNFPSIIHQSFLGKSNELLGNPRTYKQKTLTMLEDFSIEEVATIALE